MGILRALREAFLGRGEEVDEGGVGGEGEGREGIMTGEGEESLGERGRIFIVGNYDEKANKLGVKLAEHFESR